MSLPAPPQQPYPHYVPQPASSPLAPARRASVLIIVLAVLGLLLGGCMSIFGVMARMPENAAKPEFQQAFASMKGPDGNAMDPQLVGLAAIIAGFLLVAYCISLAVTGIFVRRGRLPSLIVAMILLVIGALYFLANFLVGLLGGQPSTIIMIVPLGLFGLAAVWLVQAMTRASQVAAMQGGPAHPAAPMYYNPYAYPPPPAYPGYPPAPQAPMPPPPPGQQPQP